MRIISLASFAPREHLTLRAPAVAVTYAVRRRGANRSRLVARVLFAAPGAANTK